MRIQTPSVIRTTRETVDSNNNPATLPREWVEESTRSYSDIGQFGGYGYLWWVAPNGGPHFTSAYFKGRVFSARGAGGHYIVVVPA